MILVEACVTSLEESIAAENAGAGRLELCRDLRTGGLTPSVDLVKDVIGSVGIPVSVMIRPHAGEFSAEEQNLAEMIRQVSGIYDAGADGIVLGVLDNTQCIDLPALTELINAADGLPVTFHRAFDLIEDKLAAAGELIKAGVSRVLTSGGTGSAWVNREFLRTLGSSVGSRLCIMAGGSVRADHVLTLIAETGVRELHARASAVQKIVETLKKSEL